jgi:hypothetical protein
MLDKRYFEAAPRVFENWSVSILALLNPPNMFLINKSLWNASSTAPATIKTAEGLSSWFWKTGQTQSRRFLKTLLHIQKLLALNGYELLNSI